MQTASYNPATNEIQYYEPAVEDSLRKEDQAVGLRNIGNTCYFNSLLQIYYSLPNVVEKILKFQPQGDLQGKDEVETKKIKSGLKLI
jgi:ubiquitin carboxyl-terminal hydrolase 25/28